MMTRPTRPKGELTGRKIQASSFPSTWVIVAVLAIPESIPPKSAQFPAVTWLIYNEKTEKDQQNESDNEKFEISKWKTPQNSLETEQKKHKRTKEETNRNSISRLIDPNIIDRFDTHIFFIFERKTWTFPEQKRDDSKWIFDKRLPGKSIQEQLFRKRLHKVFGFSSDFG